MEEEVNRCPQAGRLADAVGRVAEGQVGVQDPQWVGGGGWSHREAPSRAAQTPLAHCHLCICHLFFTSTIKTHIKSNIYNMVQMYKVEQWSAVGSQEAFIRYNVLL